MPLSENSCHVYKKRYMILMHFLLSEVPHKISWPYNERWVFLKELKFWNLLDLRVCDCFLNALLFLDINLHDLVTMYLNNASSLSFMEMLWHNASSESLIHWGRDKIVSISQMTFSNAFSLMKICELRVRFLRSLFLRFELTIFQHWFRWWLGTEQVASHYLKQWWLAYWRICA